MHISVIIATRDRCHSLLAAVSSLERSVVSNNLRWEVVIVDNGSTDNTREICDSLVRKDRVKYRYIYEPKKGKSVALNSGIRTSRGNVLAFIDDDCVVDKFWLQHITKEYEADSELAVLGGRVELYNEGDKPVTLVTVPQRVVFSSPDMLFPDPLIIGCNMAAKAAVFSAVGDFDILLGPGTNAIAEDVDFVYRAYKGGFKVVYFPTVLVYHNHGRSTDEEIESLVYKYYVGRGAFYLKHTLNGDIKVAGMAYRDLRSSFKRICTARGIRGELRFVRALFAGGLTRMEFKART